MPAGGDSLNFALPLMSAALDAYLHDTAAAPVLALMRDGRWRKARDAAKDLCKRDRAHYLDLLVEANAGLARELAGKGLIKDAATVVAYLETIAPPATVAALRAELAKPVPAAVAPAGQVGAALTWGSLLAGARAAAPGGISGEPDWVGIDRLVLGGYEPAVAPDDALARQLADELAAVRGACVATGDGRWDDAQAALRGVSARSVFRQWRMFLRGVRCVFQDDPETARQCFAGLPPEGALARAARTFAPKLAPAGPAAPVGARVALLLAMTGQPAAWAQPIAAAAGLWHAGKRVQAFLDLLAAMKGAFPATEPGLPAMLSEAMLPFCEHLNDEDHREAEQLHAKWRPFDMGRLSSRPDASLAAIRGTCLTQGCEPAQAAIQAVWKSYIELWSLAHGADAVRDSLLLQRLGKELVNFVGESEYIGFGSPKPDYSRARAALEKAVERDPANEGAWMDLVAVVAADKDHKAQNKLLDDLTKRFPDNKFILLKTGARAVDRKAFGKGLAALRKALALDPLDRQTREMVAAALVAQIREFRRNHRPQAPLWEELEPLLDDRPAWGHLATCRWLARLRRALLDDVPEAAAAAAAEAASLAPSDAERLVAERLLARGLGVEERSVWKEEWAALKRSGELSWRVLIGCLDLTMAFFPPESCDYPGARVGEKLNLELCKAMAGNAIKRDPDGLLELLDRMLTHSRGGGAASDGGWSSCLNYLDDEVFRVLNGKPKADPRLRLAGLLLDEQQEMGMSSPTPRFFRALEDLEKEAEAKGMAGVVTRVRALRQRWQIEQQRRPAGPSGGFDVSDDEEDEDEEDDLEPDQRIDWLLDSLRRCLAEGDPFTQELVVQLLRGAGLSQQEIDSHIRRIKATLPKRQPASGKRPPPSAPDLQQPDLPF